MRSYLIIQSTTNLFINTNCGITFGVVGTVCEVTSWEDSNKSSTWVGWENECTSDSFGKIDEAINDIGTRAGWE